MRQVIVTLYFKMKFRPEKKPLNTICPEVFCFCWVERGVHMIGPPENTRLAEESRCGCPFGKCIRLNPQNGDGDYYESNEPKLEKAGLPWFYFFTDPFNVDEESRDEYIKESKLLWGENHWLKQKE